MLRILRRLLPSLSLPRWAERRRFGTAGLFKNEALKSPEDFLLLSQDVHSTCHQLCDEVRSQNRKRKVVEIFDEMSNKICSVADMAECIRLLHPDQAYVAAAEATVGRLGTLIEELNTSKELYNIFRGSILTGDVADLDDIDRLVSNLLLRDFETSGVHLPEEQRKRFVALCAEAFSCGAEFMRRCDEPTVVPSAMAPPKLQGLMKSAGNGMVALDSGLFDSSDPEIRRLGYQLYYKSCNYQEERLCKLLACRAEIASLAGYASYADRALQQMLLDNGQEVSAFLVAILDSVRDQTKRDIQILEQYGRKMSDNSQVWDWPYLSFTARRAIYNLQTAEIMAYLRLDRLMDNLSELLKQLYGISMQVEEVERGEVWHDTVTKWVVHDERHCTLGYVYCDWYDRPGKVGDSHFTIQCGKRLQDDDYQLPIVVLSFRLAPQQPKATYLTHSQLQNVLHEIGHALHSIFGRTRYQHVSGTRCSTDIAEIPSNLMEQWAYDARMLSALTVMPDGSTMPKGLIDSLCGSQRAFGALELAQQALMALADLRLHQVKAFDREVDTVQLCRRLYADAGYADWMPNETAWHHRFSHIVPYGSKYSSYLVARAVALLYWHRCFARDPTDRVSGAKWRRLQACGGERNPSNLLCEAIGYVPGPKDLAEVLLQDLSREE
uniref:Peptidase_M3 domain-containing protein n=1 Tax=Trichuris muris TaxID=70415 RepID=A0A5S6R373_TRIMR